ncbi:HNH endonuclease [Alienimonas sp. DA493]|uniref:HNH endonuclease n=1 Tax=Alienimonas sp. DA493 TaxID=3373605 RepID=UPI003753FD5C
MSVTATVLPRQATPRSLPPIPAHTHAVIRADGILCRTFVSQRAAVKYVEGYKEAGGDGLHVVTIDGRMPPPEPGTKRHTKATRDILSAADCRCRYCGRNPTGERLVLSMMTPASQGGTNRPGNLTVCCESCSRSKGDRTPEEWADAILAAKPATRDEAAAGLKLETEGLCSMWTAPWVEAALAKLGIPTRRREILYRVPADGKEVSR